MPRLSDEDLLVRLLANSARTLPRYNGVPCLEWQGFTHKGYGRIRDGVDKRRVHVAAWQLMFGAVPEGHGVLHRCDNPPCWEPSHLWTGTQQDNIADCVNKGRHSGGTHPKLTHDQVRDIRSRAVNGQKRALAREYNITEANIRAIATRRSWAWLD